MDNYKKLTEDSVKKLVLKLSVPTIISMLVTTFYNMADTYFVSRMNSTSATGAVGVVFSMMAIIQALGFFFGHGSGNFISRSLGAGQKDNAEKMASTGFFSAFIMGIIIMAIGLIFIKPLAFILGSTKTIYPYAKDYLSIILIGAPFMCSSLVINNQLRFQGNALFAMIGIATGAIINCILDPLLITNMKMGIKGAAIATAISQLISFVLLIIGSIKSGGIQIKIKNYSPNKFYLLHILNGGTPSLLRQSIASVSTICLNVAAGSFGDYAITAMAICSKVTMFLNSAIIGFGQGFQPVCGFNYGAKKYKRVKSAFWFCVRVSFVALVIISFLAYLKAPQIIKIFSNDPLVIKFGITALRLMMVSFPLNSFIVISNMCMQTIGKSVRASILAVARQGIFLIPFLLVLPYFLGELGIQISQMCADISTLVMAIPMQITILREFDNGID